MTTVDDVPPRLMKLTPSALDGEQQSLYDAIATGPRARGPRAFPLVDADGGLEGPFNAFLLQPRLGQALQALGSSVRFDTGLSDRAREVAILVVAHAHDSAFEWYAHAAIGRNAGLTGNELDALRSDRFEVLPDEYERVVADTARIVLARGDLDDEQYTRAAEVLGLPTLFEVLTLVGYYSLLAVQLRVFRVAAPTSDA
jgi:4-carboxymuconolactone decarboxylase